MCCHNDHPLATEHNWSPNQIWLNGMMNACNPLARGEADDDPDNINDLTTKVARATVKFFPPWNILH